MSEERASRRVMSCASIVSAMTAISRVFGLVRELVMAYFFGTGNVQSAFVIAFRIPNLFRRLFGEGALGSAFTPVFVEVLQKEGREVAERFMARIMGILVCVLGLVVVAGIGATYAVEPFLEEGSRWLTVLPLMRLMLPYAVLICLAAIVSSVLYAQECFAIASLTPVVLNLVWLVVLFGVCPWLPVDPMVRITAVCVGIFMAGFVQVAFQVPTLRRVGFHFKLCFTGWWQSVHIRRVMTMMAPAALGLGLVQVNICIDGWLAYYATGWAPAALEYADRIIYLPLGVVATAFMTVLLPTYSKLHTAGNQEEFAATINRALHNITLLMIPGAIGLMCLAEPVVKLLYQHGKFDADSVCYTARAVAAYAPGLLIFSYNKVITPAFYAMQDLKTPVWVAAGCVVLNFSCNLVAIFWLPYGWQHVGMAVSTVVSSAVNTIVLIFLLRRRIPRAFLTQWGMVCGKGILAGALMGGVAYAVLYGLHGVLPDGKLVQVVVISVTMAVAALVYSGAIRVLAPQSLRELLEDLPLERLLRKVHLCK